MGYFTAESYEFVAPHDLLPSRIVTLGHRTCMFGAVRATERWSIVQAYSEKAIRKSFINCSKGAAARIHIPAHVLGADWGSQVFVSWADPKAPQRAYLVAETAQGLQGLTMEIRKAPTGGGPRMCQICRTLHPSSGASLMSIVTTKSAQDNYGSIGTYMCSDLACVDYVRGTKTPDGTTQMTETLTVEEKEERVLTNVRSLIASVENRLKK